MQKNQSTTWTKKETFPSPEVERRLRWGLSRLNDDTSAIREPWEPALDSLAVVGVLLLVEELLPDFRIAPEKVIRKGGYESVDDATRDIVNRLHNDWRKKQK